MPVVSCPISGCTYETPDMDPAIVAALLTAHAIEHSTTTHNTTTPTTTPSQPTDMPAEIQMLLIPDPDEDGLYRNSVVNSIFKDVPYSSMASMASFVSFCVNQREERLKLHKKYSGLMKLGEHLQCSEDGRWANVRKFRKIETVDRKLYQSSNKAIKFLSSHVRKIDEALDDLKRRKTSTQSVTLIKQHHTNTINFLQGMEVKLRDQKVEMECALDQVERKCERPSASVQKGTSSRKEENRRRSEKDKALRLRNRCASLLQEILKNPRPDWAGLIKQKKFEFSVCPQDVNVPALHDLVVRTHLEPLMHLFKQGVFNADKVFHDQIMNRIEDMQREQSATTEKNLKRKAREGLNKSADERQKRLTTGLATTIGSPSPPSAKKSRVLPKTPTASGKQKSIFQFASPSSQRSSSQPTTPTPSTPTSTSSVTTLTPASRSTTPMTPSSRSTTPMTPSSPLVIELSDSEDEVIEI